MEGTLKIDSNKGDASWCLGKAKPLEFVHPCISLANKIYDKATVYFLEFVLM
jgi:hypothetical protein